MSLQNKYAGVIESANTSQISELSVREQDGILYISGNASSSAAKDAVWNALSEIDPTYSSTDVNIDIQVVGLAAGTRLTVITENSNLNIRLEPSTEADIVGKAAKGESVSLVEQSSDEWWKVRTDDGEEGYAYSRYLQA